MGQEYFKDGCQMRIQVEVINLQRFGETETTGDLGMVGWSLSGDLLFALRFETKALEPSLVAVLTLSS